MPVDNANLVTSFALGPFCHRSSGCQFSFAFAGFSDKRRPISLSSPSTENSDVHCRSKPSIATLFFFNSSVNLSFLFFFFSFCFLTNTNGSYVVQTQSCSFIIFKDGLIAGNE